MSLLSFTKCFIGAGGEQAATALTTAMVKMAPETATAAELKAGGVEFMQDPKKADWGTSAIFKDQDGNLFVLSTP